MGRTIKIKKLLLAVLALSMIAMTMSGCVYANNTSWDDMTAEEQEAVRQEFFEDMEEELEASSSGNRLEEEFLHFIFDNVQQAMEDEN